MSNRLFTPGRQGPTDEQRAAFKVNTWAELFKAALTGEAARVGGDSDITVKRAAEIADIAFITLMKKTNEFFQKEQANG